MSTPDLLSYLKKGEFTIKCKDSAAVVVSLALEVQGQKTPLTLYIDPKAFVIKRMEFPTPMAGMFQVGYRYKLFEGHLVLDEVNTVIGTMGFSRFHISGYKKVRKKSSFFRGF